MQEGNELKKNKSSGPDNLSSKLAVAYGKGSAAKWVIKIKVTITKMMTDVYNNNLFLDVLLHIEWK